MKYIITKPKVDPFGHCGDTFRELVDLWEEAGLVTVEYADTIYVWWGKVGDVVLYDRPTLQWYNAAIPNKGVLWGNTVPTGGKSWIFWGRSPRLLNAIHTIPKYSDRSIESIFLGKIENQIQYTNRTKHDWSKFIQIFEMPINGEYKYTKQEYLNLVLNSKFGLCLPGYGPKCNREIELLACGTVPIITPGVDLTYYNSLEENIHYIRVDSPDEIKEKIESISAEKWKEISKNCLDWYEKNASIYGSFEITKKIVEEGKTI